MVGGMVWGGYAQADAFGRATMPCGHGHVMPCHVDMGMSLSDEAFGQDNFVLGQGLWHINNALVG